MLDLFCCGIWLLLGFLDVIAFRKVDTEARSQDREEDEGADVETEERALAGSWHVSGWFAIRAHLLRMDWGSHPDLALWKDAFSRICSVRMPRVFPSTVFASCECLLGWKHSRMWPKTTLLDPTKGAVPCSRKQGHASLGSVPISGAKLEGFKGPGTSAGSGPGRGGGLKEGKAWLPWLGLWGCGAGCCVNFLITKYDKYLFQWLSDVYWPTATFQQKPSVKTPAFQTDFQNFCNFQLSGQLEEREMARARASYVFPLFKAGVGEETPAEIGILRMMWILSMKLGPDMMKITLWILKNHFCGSNDMAKMTQTSQQNQCTQLHKFLKRSFWAQHRRGNMRKSTRGCFGWRGFGSGKTLGMVDDPWMISRLGEISIHQHTILRFFLSSHVLLLLRTNFNGSLADMARTASEGTVSLSTQMIAIEDAMTKANYRTTGFSKRAKRSEWSCESSWCSRGNSLALLWPFIFQRRYTCIYNIYICMYINYTYTSF